MGGDVARASWRRTEPRVRGFRLDRHALAAGNPGLHRGWPGQHDRGARARLLHRLGNAFLEARPLHGRALPRSPRVDDAGRHRCPGHDRPDRREPADSSSSPMATAISAASASRWCPAPRWSRPKRWWIEVAARLSEEQEVALALGTANEGSGRISLVLRDDRVRTSIDFEREMTPVLQDIPDARVNFQNRQGGGGGTGRAISIMLAGSDPELLYETAQHAGRTDGSGRGCRGAAHRRRSPAARTDHRAARGPGRQPWRHHQRAEPGDPHRHAGRYRPERRQVLAFRPADPDPRAACRE